MITQGVLDHFRTHGVVLEAVGGQIDIDRIANALDNGVHYELRRTKPQVFPMLRCDTAVPARSEILIPYLTNC